MPNRIIKESICTSGNLDALSPAEENLFYRILVNCDDYGRIDGRPTIIRSKCYPLRIDKIKDKEITEWLQHLVQQHLIRPYHVGGEPYIQVITWAKHQQIRAKRSRYPEPPITEEQMPTTDEQPQADDIVRNQVIANVPVIQSNPIQSNQNPKRESNTESDTTNKPEKRSYGENGLVKLTDDDYQKLIARLGDEATQTYVKRLALYIGSKGKQYKSHYMTILAWHEKDKTLGGNGNGAHQEQPTKRGYSREEYIQGMQ